MKFDDDEVETIKDEEKSIIEEFPALKVFESAEVEESIKEKPKSKNAKMQKSEDLPRDDQIYLASIWLDTHTRARVRAEYTDEYKRYTRLVKFLKSNGKEYTPKPIAPSKQTKNHPI